MSELSRRRFVAAAPAAGLAAYAGTTGEKPALLGGPKVRSNAFPEWPKFDDREERALLEVVRSGKWGRGGGQFVRKFEQAYATLTGSKQVLATANGTSALVVSLNVAGVEPGDEVVIPPYTFIATVNAVLRQYALPVFVDSDPETFQIDARKVDAAINGDTRVIMPVHLGGNVCDLDALGAIAKKRNVAMIEDACQAHLAEWKGQKAGTFGMTGCFSFQASKNLNSGEGGAVLLQSDELFEKAYTFHNNGSGPKPGGRSFSYTGTGMNLRLTEFQAAMLLAQMTRLELQARTRTENASHLTSMLKQIPGITPAAQYAGCTNNAYHLYMLRYDSTAFAGLPRDKFLTALRAEGIPGSGGYLPLNKQPFLKTAMASRGFQRLFSKKRLKQWEERNQCPANDKLCEQAVWFTQNVLLGSRTDMEQIAEAFRKIQSHAGELVKAG